MCRIWCLFCLLLLVACSGDKGSVAGSTIETENTVAVNVVLADGQVAARTRLTVRPENYLPGSVEHDDEVVNDSIRGVWNTVTDEKGFARMPRFASGNYLVEAVGKSEKAIQKLVIAVEDSNEIFVNVKLGPTVSLSGKVDVAGFFAGARPNGSVRVGIKGLEYFAEVAEDGSFAFDSLPVGDFAVEAFVLTSMRTCVASLDGDDCSNVFYVSTIGVENISIAETAANIEFKKDAPAVPVVPVDSVAKEETPTEQVPDVPAIEPVVYDSTETPKNPENSEKPVDSLVVQPAVDSTDFDIAVNDYKFVMDDFENGVLKWYRSSSRYATSTLVADTAGLGRPGYAGHFEYSNDSLFNWTLMGHYFGDFKDFSTLDSIKFWARGNDLISVSLDMYLDSLHHGKAWAKFELQNKWTEYVLTPEMFLDADSIGGNVGWDAVKNSVTSINIFGGVGSEFWIDDIEIYGVKKLE